MWLLRFPKSTFQFASNHHATIKHVVLKVLEEDGLSEYLPALAGGGCVDLQSFHRLCDQRFFFEIFEFFSENVGKIVEKGQNWVKKGKFL